MSIRRFCRSFVLGIVLFGGSIIGLPMRPEEIEELLYAMNRPWVEVSIDEVDARQGLASNMPGMHPRGTNPPSPDRDVR